MIQGRSLSAREIATVVKCLKDEDMTIIQIAKRCGVSKGSVAAINKRYGIREYNGRKLTWSMIGTEANAVEVET